MGPDCADTTLYSMTTHKRLRNMTKSTDSGSAAQSSQDCSICLNSIAVSHHVATVSLQRPKAGS